MQKLIIAIAAGALGLGGCAQIGGPGRERERERGEARLAAMIAGRIPGEPRDCIAAFNLGRLEILDRTAVVYDGAKTIWVSRPADPGSLDTRDMVVVKRSGGRLCRQDVIRTVDRINQFTTGVVFLGAFVPYRQP